MRNSEHFPLIDLGAQVGFSRHIGGIVTTSALLRQCGLRPGLRVLEVGCGTGRTAAHIAEHAGCQVDAVDVHPGMVEWARRHVRDRGVVSQVDVSEGDVRDLHWPDDHFDAVICESVLVLLEDKAAGLSEMARVTRPGGVVGLNEGTLMGEGDPPAAVSDYASDALGGVAFERPATWTDLLAGAGLLRVSADEHPFRVADELRTITSWIGVREYGAVLARLVRAYRDDPDLRDLIKGGFGTPRDVTRYLGAGIYVGEVPVA